MALAENINVIIAASPALERAPAKRKESLAKKLIAAEHEYKAQLNAERRLGRVTRGEMRRDFNRAKRAAAQLEKTMNTAAMRRLLWGGTYNPETVDSQLKLAQRLLSDIESDSRRVGGSSTGRGGARHHGDLFLHRLVERLVQAYRATTREDASASVRPLDREKGGPLVRYVQECFRLLGVRLRSAVAIRNLVNRVAPPSRAISQSPKTGRIS